jgi:hypothetical protein
MSPDKPPNEENIISEYYEGYQQTQAEIFERETKRVRRSVIIIGILLFASDFLGLAVSDSITSTALLYIFIIPAVLVAIAMIFIRQPMLSAILATLIFLGIIILSIIAFGGLGAISGILVKAIIIYLLLAAFQSARTAEKAKKEMQAR